MICGLACEVWAFGSGEERAGTKKISRVVVPVRCSPRRAEEDFLKETNNESLGPGFVGGTARHCEFWVLWDNCQGQQRLARSRAAIHHGATCKPDSDRGPNG